MTVLKKQDRINYSGNPNLKKIGVQFEYTEDQIVELAKCAEDPIYFLENYGYIVTLDHGIQPFKLWDFQKDFVKIIHNNRMVAALLPRQSSKTQLSVGYILWYTLFQSNKTVAIVANKDETAREVLSRYQLMYEHVPLWMQQGLNSWNKGSLELENGSKIFTAATSASGLRGRSCNLIMIDEAAIIPNNIAEQFFAATYPVISSGKTTKIIMASTPLGYNHFWKFWNDAEQGRNDFVPFTVPYWKVPGRDEKWADEQKRLLGEVKFNQEVLCKFLGSTNTLIRSDIIGQMSYIPPIYTAEGLDLYEMKEPGHIYTIVVDIAKGVGGDYSAFTIIDVTEVPYKVIGKYRDNTIAPLLFPSVIYRLAKEYNDAYVLCEINSSDQVPHILYEEYEYENLLFIQRDARGQKVSSGFGGPNMQYGVNTDKKTKRIGCFNFKSLLEEKKLLVFDADIISEISTFVEKRGSYEADDGYHDDLIITLVLFGWLTTNLYFKELTDVNLRRLMYEKRIKEIEEEMLPIGYMNDGDKVDIQEMVEDGDIWAPYDKTESPYKVPSSYLTNRL